MGFGLWLAALEGILADVNASILNRLFVCVINHLGRKRIAVEQETIDVYPVSYRFRRLFSTRISLESSSGSCSEVRIEGNWLAFCFGKVTRFVGFGRWLSRRVACLDEFRFIMRKRVGLSVGTIKIGTG